MLFFKLLPCFITVSFGFPIVGLATYPSIHFGNKTHNLEQLEALCTRIDGQVACAPWPTWNVRVPPFIGISHDQVSTFLREHELPVEDEWNTILMHHHLESGSPARQQLLATKKFPNNFLTDLQALGTRVASIFKRNPFPFSREQTDFFRCHNSQKFAIRSTSHEDSHELANAGGNETVVGVTPIPEHIASAMGTVVASYIGEKSLKQRLAVATTEDHVNEILRPPFIPVLLQVMIGEQIEKTIIPSVEDVATIPVSGVMFTTEAEAQTMGVTCIQTTWGLGEGVVNSRCPCDTFYVDAFDGVYPIIKKKWHRLVPSPEGVQEKRNIYEPPLEPREELTREECLGFAVYPSLPFDAVIALKHLGVKIQEDFAASTDVEFVVQPAQRTIYLVQARPIIFQEKHPSYLSYPFFNDQLQHHLVIQGVKIGVGHATVKKIDLAQNILFATTLSEALEKYLDLSSENRHNIACVCVQTMAAQTSHEATTMRAENIPVIQYNNIEDVKSYVSRPENALIVDPQRGILIKTTIDQRLDAVVIDGWFESPLQKRLSVCPAFLNLQASILSVTTAPMFDNFCAWLTTALPRFKEAHAMKAHSTKQLLEIIKQSTASDLPHVRDTLGIILHRLLQIVPQKENLTSLFTRIFARITTPIQVLQWTRTSDEVAYVFSTTTNIFRIALLCCTEIMQQMSSVDLPRDLRILFWTNILEALFYQDTDDQTVNTHSIKTVLHLARQELLGLGLLAADEQPTLKQITLALVSQDALTPETARIWLDFLHNLSQLGSQEEFLSPDAQKNALDNLTSIIFDLNKLDMIPLFINVIFLMIHQFHDGNPVYIAEELYTQAKKARPFLYELFTHKQELLSFDVSQLSDPEKFPKLWPDLANKLNYFDQPRFLGAFQPSLRVNDLQQLSALSVMPTVIMVLDTAIKTIKGSTLYTNIGLKASRVKTMVEKDWELLEAWMHYVPEGTFKRIMRGQLEGTEPLFVNITDQTIHNQLSTLRLMPLPSHQALIKRQLVASRHFVVARVAVSSVTDGADPETIEDYFTLAHQNLLAVCAALTRHIIDVNSFPLPAAAHLLKNAIEQPLILFDRPVQPALIGITFDKYRLLLEYNMPLGTHSMALTISSHKNSMCSLSCRFLNRGQNSPEDAKMLVSYAILAEKQKLTRLSTCDVENLDTVFTWDIGSHSTSRQLAQLIHILHSMALITIHTWTPGEETPVIAISTTTQEQLMCHPYYTKNFSDEEPPHQRIRTGL